MRTLKITGIVLLFLLLTILSQVGGLILLLWIPLFRRFKNKIPIVWMRHCSNVLGFILFYLIFNLSILPALSYTIHKRVQLPISKSGNLAPVSYWTALLNRNYITQKGKEKLELIAERFSSKNPGMKLKYMDCNHPLKINIGEKNIWILESLFPHLSHIGDKADIAFIYNDENGVPSNYTPTAIGYGSSVEPLKNEPCTPCDCDKKKWFYSFMYRTLPQANYTLNSGKSRELILNFRRELNSAILIEKHLQKRFKLKGNFKEAGCHSVRHDDHFHVQFK